jgi:tRNA A37 threonylcarbamoyladenosine dehydratase
MADILSALKGFLTQHSSELRVLTGVVAQVVDALPIGQQDKAKADAALEALNNAADNIAAAVAGIKSGPTVTVKKSDILAAVRDALPAIVAAELAKRPGLAPAPKASASAKADK